MDDESLDKMDPYQRGANDISKLSIKYLFQAYISTRILKTQPVAIYIFIKQSSFINIFQVVQSTF